MENGKMDLFSENAWAMNTNKENLDQKEIARLQNEGFEKHRAIINEKVDRELAKANEVKEKMNSLEIMPAGQYVLVKPYATNPYEKIEVTNSGLVIPTYDGKFKNPDTGEEDVEDNFSRQGTVIAVGPLVKWIKEGDDVFYRKMQAVPVPFFRQGFEVIPESGIQCVVNEGITERWASIK